MGCKNLCCERVEVDTILTDVCRRLSLEPVGSVCYVGEDMP
jgi:hypothetical protein